MNLAAAKECESSARDPQMARRTGRKYVSYLSAICTWIAFVYQARPLCETKSCMQAFKRIGQPEVADLIVFLASGKARWITGATIPVDGGSKLWIVPGIQPFCMSDRNRVDSDVAASANTLLRRSNQIGLVGPSVKTYYVTLDCRPHFSVIAAPDYSHPFTCPWRG